LGALSASIIIGITGLNRKILGLRLRPISFMA